MSNSIGAVKQHILNLIENLTPFLIFANCHMVDFFTQSSFKNVVPVDIQKEVATIGEEAFIDLLFENDFSKTPHLKRFVNFSRKYTLKNLDICLTVEEFFKHYCGHEDVDRFKLEIFMTMKKSHEVEIMSAIAASVSKVVDISHIIDIGDGKGYLSSMLAFHYKLPVLGIDASNVNTCGANKRATKLSKIWNNIPNSPRKSFPKKNENVATENVCLYKQSTVFVDDETDLQKLVVEAFVDVPLPVKLGLVGLHTCGNLSTNSIRIFCKSDSIKSICNVGCCYHLLTERFEISSDLSVDYGFPMSQFLLDKKIVLGRRARMIANQSVDRILDTKELPNVTIFYRALLEVLLQQHSSDLSTKHVGKFRKPPKNFTEYARTAVKRIGVNIDITDQELESLHLSYFNQLNELNIFYLLRCRLSPVIESLILLDRLLFLLEQGYENSFVVRFFEPVVSPRCYGIVAMK